MAGPCLVRTQEMSGEKSGLPCPGLRPRPHSTSGHSEQAARPIRRRAVRGDRCGLGGGNRAGPISRSLGNPEDGPVSRSFCCDCRFSGSASLDLYCLGFDGDRCSWRRVASSPLLGHRSRRPCASVHRRRRSGVGARGRARALGVPNRRRIRVRRSGWDTGIDAVRSRFDRDQRRPGMAQGLRARDHDRHGRSERDYRRPVGRGGRRDLAHRTPFESRGI